MNSQCISANLSSVSGSRLMNARFLPLAVIFAAILVPRATGQGASISTERRIYAPNTSIVVNYANLPGNTQDWITVVTAGSADNKYGQWTYTKGNRSGSYTFRGLPAGKYEARVYFNWPKDGYKVQARYMFTVGSGPISTSVAGGNRAHALWALGVQIGFTELGANRNVEPSLLQQSLAHALDAANQLDCIPQAMRDRIASLQRRMQGASSSRPLYSDILTLRLDMASIVAACPCNS